MNGYGHFAARVALGSRPTGTFFAALLLVIAARVLGAWRRAIVAGGRLQPRDGALRGPQWRSCSAGLGFRRARQLDLLQHQRTQPLPRRPTSCVDRPGALRKGVSQVQGPRSAAISSTCGRTSTSIRRSAACRISRPLSSRQQARRADKRGCMSRSIRGAQLHLQGGRRPCSSSSTTRQAGYWIYKLAQPLGRGASLDFDFTVDARRTRLHQQRPAAVDRRRRPALGSQLQRHVLQQRYDVPAPGLQRVQPDHRSH